MKELKNHYGAFSLFRLAAVAAVFAAMLSFSAPARAQCEDPGTASAAVAGMSSSMITALNSWISQQEAYIDRVFFYSMYPHILQRLEKFTWDFWAWMNDWWNDDFTPVLKGFAKEYALSSIDQTRMIGSYFDAQLMLEEKLRNEERIIESLHRYAPSGLACDIDGAAKGLARAYQISRQVNLGLSFDDIHRHANDRNSISAVGKGEETKKMWQEYTTYFCDNSMGDLGCTAPAPLAGRHKSVPQLLWGSRQTIEIDDSGDALRSIRAAMRYLINPLSPDPILKDAANTVTGRYTLLGRRAEIAYTNAIYNVIGAMISERIEGSGLDVSDMRRAVGIHDDDISENASYRELSEVITRDRYQHPEMIVRLIENPVQMAREQDALNVLRLQTMNDIYRRQEELLFMEAAAYGRDLNSMAPTDKAFAGEGVTP